MIGKLCANIMQFLYRFEKVEVRNGNLWLMYNLESLTNKPDESCMVAKKN